MRRLKNIFRNNGRTVIVALDHGMALNVLPELEDTASVLQGIIQSGVDAVLTSFGIAAKYEELLSSTGLILRLDGGNSMLSDNPGGKLLFTPEDALRLGADGVACMGFPGAVNEEQTLINIASMAARCRHWNVPLMAEMLPGGFGDEPPKTAENIKLSCRIGAELGASIIKTTYVGAREEFEEVTRGCFVPVVILGGTKTEDLEGLFRVVRDAMDAGAAGVVIGRNVWRSENPQRITSALVDLVHHDITTEEAMKIVAGRS
ncbi:MAG: fructose-bisphosphate aldolase [Spirochaetes bacterium]|nr:MAG: fructose-bisphosphate aldolase [Spirochaetota bacterium]